MRRLWFVGLLALGMLSQVWQGDARAADPSAGELIRLLDAADKQYAQVHDYTAVMVSRERVKDGLQAGVERSSGPGMGTTTPSASRSSANMRS